jgi:beta-N-acetylhexosaminidase
VRRAPIVAAAALALVTGCTSPGRPQIGSTATGGAPGPSTSAPGVTTSSGPACEALSVVDRWPVTQRAAQLVVAPALDGGVSALHDTVAQGVGGLLLLGHGAPSDLRDQVDSVNRLTTTPLFVMADQEGGGVSRLNLATTLPWPRQMAATMTADQVQGAATAIAGQMLAVGVNVDLAPVLDIDAGEGPNERNADGPRSFGGSSVTVTRYGVAFLKGLRAGGVVPVVKHFPGLGGASRNTDYGPADTPPLTELRRSGLLPFEAALAANVPAVMVANAAMPGLTTSPAVLSAAAVTGLLRGELSFRGLVVTDSLSAGAVTAAGYDVPRAAVAAVEAGSDMVLFGSTLTAAEAALLSPTNVASTTAAIVDALARAVQAGQLPVARLDQAVLHVLGAKGVKPCG